MPCWRYQNESLCQTIPRVGTQWELSNHFQDPAQLPAPPPVLQAWPTRWQISTASYLQNHFTNKYKWFDQLFGTITYVTSLGGKKIIKSRPRISLNKNEMLSDGDEDDDWDWPGDRSAGDTNLRALYLSAHLNTVTAYVACYYCHHPNLAVKNV